MEDIQLRVSCQQCKCIGLSRTRRDGYHGGEMFVVLMVEWSLCMISIEF